MMSVQMRAAHAWAEEEDKKLRADDNRFNYFVYMVHEDGSTMLYTSAFAVRYPKVSGGVSGAENDFVCIFTEHHGFHVEAMDDLRVLHMLERVELE